MRVIHVTRSIYVFRFKVQSSSPYTLDYTSSLFLLLIITTTTTKKGKEPIKGQLSLHYPGSHAFYVPIMSLLTIFCPAVTLVLL